MLMESASYKIDFEFGRFAISVRLDPIDPKDGNRNIPGWEWS